MLLIYHVFVAIVYFFQENYLVPLVRFPAILFIGDIWTDKFAKYYTMFIGLFIAMVGLITVTETPVAWLDLGFGLLTMYYASKKE
jgi:hypothetical protein